MYRLRGVPLQTLSSLWGLIDCCYDLNNEGCGQGTWKISKCNISPTLHAVLLHNYVQVKSTYVMEFMFVLWILAQKPGFGC